MPRRGGPFIKGHVSLFEGDVVHYVYPGLLDKWADRFLDLGTESPHPFPAPWGLEAQVREKMVLRLAPHHGLG